MIANGYEELRYFNTVYGKLCIGGIERPFYFTLLVNIIIPHDKEVKDYRKINKSIIFEFLQQHVNSWQESTAKNIMLRNIIEYPITFYFRTDYQNGSDKRNFPIYKYF